MSRFEPNDPWDTVAKFKDRALCRARDGTIWMPTRYEFEGSTYGQPSFAFWGRIVARSPFEWLRGLIDATRSL